MAGGREEVEATKFKLTQGMILFFLSPFGELAKRGISCGCSDIFDELPG